MNVLSLTIDFFKPKIPTLISYAILNLAYPINNIGIPHYYGKLIEDMLQNKSVKVSFIITLTLWIFYIFGLYGLSQIDIKLIPEFRAYLYKHIAKYIFEIHKENYTTLQIGEIISKLSKLPYLILEIFYQVRNSYLPLIYMTFFSTIYFFWINVKLGFLVLIFIMVFFILAYKSYDKCMDSCVISENLSDKSNEDLQDVLENVLNVFTSDNIEGEMKTFDIGNNNLSDAFRKCIKCSSGFKTKSSILYIIAFFSIGIFCYYLYKNKEIELSQFNSSMLVIVYLLSQIDGTMQYSQDTMTYVGSIIDIQKYIDRLNDTYVSSNLKKEKINSVKPESLENDMTGNVEFKDISVYNGDKCVLNNFSYNIKAGEKVAIIGSVGSGKSTLLKLMLKLAYPTSGMILFDGKNLPYNTIRKYVSYIPQTPILFNRTLYKNITYGTNKTKEDVMEIMNKYGISFGSHTLDSDVGKSGNNLSGGQKQLVMLLRAILREPKIILLDEPTSALDTDTKNIILKLIFDVFKKQTVIMITHDNDVMNKFPVVINLDDFKK